MPLAGKQMFGLTPFETLMAVAWVAAILARVAEWVFKRNVDAEAFVTKASWEQGRAKDLDEAKHFTRNMVGTYVTRELYERDWKETNRRLAHLERMEAST